MDVSEKDQVISRKFIDVDNLIASKNPRLLKRLPKFLLNYLKRIIHVDEVNDFIYRHRTDFGFDFVKAIINDFKINVVYEGLENLPKEGKQFVVSNHPLGGIDGIALTYIANKVREDVMFPVNDLLMNIPQLKPLFIPINKHGKNTENLRILEENFAKEQLLLYFPAGLVSRKQNGQIRDLDWKHTFINKAIKHKRDVIPALVQARNSNWFYNLANFRKRIGIKANIEMLYLPDEMYKLQGSTIKIIFGEPISYSMFDKSKTPAQWAEHVKGVVYNLG